MTVSGKSVLDAIATSLLDAGRYNSDDKTRPVAVLWPDPERHWEPIVAKLSGIFHTAALGDFNELKSTGPAIWIRSLLANSDQSSSGLPLWFISQACPVATFGRLKALLPPFDLWQNFSSAPRGGSSRIRRRGLQALSSEAQTVSNLTLRGTARQRKTSPWCYLNSATGSRRSPQRRSLGRVVLFLAAGSRRDKGTVVLAKRARGHKTGAKRQRMEHLCPDPSQPSAWIRMPRAH